MTGNKLLNLQRIFYPANVAVLGATDSPEKVGYNLLESIIYGGFKGNIYPVNPKHKSILGVAAYPTLDDIPEKIDLAVVGLNREASVEAVEHCGRLGVKGAVCIASGFRETGNQGLALEKRLIEISRKYGIKVIGPNTLGMINTEACLNTTFYPLQLKSGNITIITQSGGIGFYILQRVMDEGLGINKWIGVGNRTVLEIADYLEYLDEDPGTAVIGIFVEGVEDGRRLVRLAGQISKRKPIVVYKVGRSNDVNYAALSHTGSMAGSHQVFNDIFAQFGVLVVESVPEMVAACKALSLCGVPGGDRAGIYTYTAGPSIVALDQFARHSVPVPALSEQTYKRLKDILGTKVPVVYKNPFDSAGIGYLPETYGELVRAIIDDPRIDLVITFCCVHKTWRNPTRELITVKKATNKPVLACYISTWQGCGQDRRELQDAGIPLYTSPDEAAWGAAALAFYSRFRNKAGAC